MTILFFTYISPLPSNGGEKIRSYYLLKALSELGYKLIAIVQNEENIDFGSYNIENVTFYTHTKKPLTIIERLTCKHLFQRSNEILNVFEEVCMSHNIDVAFLDYGFIGHYQKFFDSKKIPVILGTHNAQPMITKQVPARSLIKKIRRFQLVCLEKLHERLYFKYASAILVVSENDKKYHESFIAKEKIFIVPNFLDEKEYIISSTRRPNILVMTANFGVHMNYMGLKWFIEKIWDEELAAKFELLLVGKDSKEALLKLTGSDNWKNIKALGKVDDVKWYISIAIGAIIPLLHGSGTRLKCLEAMSLKTPIISTSKGVEGIVSNNFIIADEPTKFKRSINEFKHSVVIGNALRQDFMKEYSFEINKQRLDRIIKSILNK